jgi:hypothetical protein
MGIPPTVVLNSFFRSVLSSAFFSAIFTSDKFGLFRTDVAPASLSNQVISMQKRGYFTTTA